MNVIEADTTVLLKVIQLIQQYQLTPEFILAHQHIGDYSITMSHYPKSLGHFQIALKAALETNSPTREVYLSELGIARSYMLLNRILDAQEIFLKYLSYTKSQLEKAGTDSAQNEFPNFVPQINLLV